jgi:AcrR family transcriptional regulator
MYHLDNFLARVFSVVIGSARQALLARVVDDVAANGLGDRSLRDLAAAVDSSHRLLLYHFGSRDGLVEAIVDAVEASQRDLLDELARDIHDPVALVLALWERVSSPVLRPFVRLFFESVAHRGPVSGEAVTAPWLERSRSATAMMGIAFDPVDIRLGIAVVRGLLIDVLATGDVDSATASLHRFLQLWQPRSGADPRR